MIFFLTGPPASWPVGWVKGVGREQSAYLPYIVPSYCILRNICSVLTRLPRRFAIVGDCAIYFSREKVRITIVCSVLYHLINAWVQQLLRGIAKRVIVLSLRNV